MTVLDVICAVASRPSVFNFHSANFFHAEGRRGTIALQRVPAARKADMVSVSI